MKDVPAMPNVAECDKLTWDQLVSKVLTFNKEHNVHYAGPENQAIMVCRVVFNPLKSGWKKYHDSWVNGSRVEDHSRPITYTPAGCTYQFDNLGKYWDSDCGGSSIFGYSLDPNDFDSFGIKLSDYIHDWAIDYCYIVSENGIQKY